MQKTTPLEKYVIKSAYTQNNKVRERDHDDNDGKKEKHGRQFLSLFEFSQFFHLKTLYSFFWVKYLCEIFINFLLFKNKKKKQFSKCEFYFRFLVRKKIKCCERKLITQKKKIVAENRERVLVRLHKENGIKHPPFF